MHFVITPTDPSIAHVNLDIEEMEKTVQVIFILVSGLLAWHQTLCVCFSVCLFDLFSFASLTTYFVCSYKRTSVTRFAVFSTADRNPLCQLSLLSLMFYMILDINECEGRTPKCSSNAVCNNTKGSYNCTCKSGYEGDGNNCTGDIFKM